MLPETPYPEGGTWSFHRPRDLLNMEGKEWKSWRAIFNPGFSAKNILMLVPSFLKEIDVIVDSLRGAADSEKVISMKREDYHVHH